MALILAFGLTLAVGRYDARRTAVVATANAIGTTYLRAQTLREPMARGLSTTFVQYTDATIRLSRAVPATPAARAAIADGVFLQRSLCALRRRGPRQRTDDSAPRLYVETLNEMIDMQTVQVSALNNRVPGAVLGIEIAGAAVALGLLALYLAILARGVLSVVLAAGFVSVLLLLTFDLDRPVRGLSPSRPRRSSTCARRWSCPPQPRGRAERRRPSALDARDETRHRVDRLRPR